MTRHLLQILFVFSLILFLAQCAQQGQLTGGTKDMLPPKLLEALPAKNSTNFKEELVTLKFDEFVQVKDLSNQLIVTPRLKTQPDISANGKKIIIKFKKEELAPNTTYRIYMGQAIADMNESNPIPNFEYVFSTGSVIDTVEAKGDITDAFTNKPSADILVGLYYNEKTTDSLPYKKEPDYIARTNENGQFLLKNLPYKTFRVFAFSDKNKNSLYDGESERIAFLGPDLKLISDTSIHLKLFQEEASKSFIKKTAAPYFGFTQIILNKKVKVKVSTLKAANSANISETRIGEAKDTVSLHYRNTVDTLKLVLQNLATEKRDTLKLTLPRNNSKKRLKSFTVNTIGNKLALYDKVRLTFLNWMDTSRSDLSKIYVSSKQDSLISDVPVKGRWKDITSFEIDHQLKEGMTYTLKIDTNAFFDLNQFTNDSSNITFITQSKIEFGKLTLKLLFNSNKYPKQQYVVQLITDQDKVVKEQFGTNSNTTDTAATLVFTDVLPGTYFAKIIFDDNKNKKWDSGNILQKQQAEKVIINSKQLKILSDWEIEEEIQAKE